uniref:Putative outcast ele5 orf2-h 1e-60-j 4 n=1 Tax=Amblyomma cajennense TaxID=34607 RepID=A0A023FFT7_AMBCJ
MVEGVVQSQKLPALLYADDIVLVADSGEELQRLLDVCSLRASQLGLRFSARKSAVMTWGAPEMGDVGQVLTLQERVIPSVSSYRYLGVQLTAGGDYLVAHEKLAHEKALRGQGVLKARALWAFSRMEVVRGLWKAVMVPGLTFGNAVLCLSSATREFLERRQREVGRQALGAHRSTPNEAVQGDVGWSAFEAREAVAKLGFEIRSWALGQERWVNRVRRCLLYSSLSTRWVKRVRGLATKFEVPLPALCDLKGTSLSRGQLRARVSATETHRWRTTAENKSALSTYCARKTEIKQERFYDNSVGSSLLFEARAGVLRTRLWWAKCKRQDATEAEVTCVVCQQEKETAEHVVLTCPVLQPQHPVGTLFAQALGFPPLRPLDGNAAAIATADIGGTDAVADAVKTTKRRLTLWRELSMKTRKTPK